ncbi:MAG: MMPL family transporter [Phycisphaerae bacterium]
MAVVAYPKVTLAVCAALLVASVVFAWTNLSLSTDENALLAPKLKFFQDYLKFDAKFPENEAFVVVVEPVDQAHPPLAKRWIALADAISDKLGTLKEDVDRVDTHAPLAELGVQGPMFDEWAGIKEESAQLREMVPLLRIIAEKPGGLFDLKSAVLGRNMTERFFNAMRDAQPKDANDFVTLVAGSLHKALATDSASWTAAGGEIPNLTELDPAAKTDPSRYGYYVIPDESKRFDPAHKHDLILIINVYENRDYSTLADVSEPLRRMREAVKSVADQYPDFRVGITGRPALEADEMATSDHDTRIAEICGLSLVFVVLWIFLRRLWLVIVAEVCLGVGIGWTFGWATLSTGRLNLLSLVFVIALIGIGMDYLIQILTRYRYEKKRYSRPSAIWARVFRYVSAPISTACLGAAGAFFAACFTNFSGAAELGVIAGGGLLLCLLSGYTLLPAMLTLFPSDVGRVEEGNRYADEKKTARVGWVRTVLQGVWILVALGGLWLALPPQFDPDLIKLQAQGLQSVQLVHKLPTWYAAVMTDDLEKLRAARAALSPSPNSTILRTDSILEAIDKQRWMAEHNADLKEIHWSAPAPPDASDLPAIARAAQGVVEAWKRKGADVTNLQAAVGPLVAALDEKAGAEAKASRVGAWQRAFVNELHETVAGFIPPPLNLEKLPAEVRDHFVSYREGIAAPRSERAPASGPATNHAASPTYAMYIYPKEDLWSGDKLQRFVSEVEQRCPKDVTLTGIAVQLFHSTEEIHHAFLMSTLYALGLIFALVLLDLRKLTQTFLAISVLAFGLPMLLLMMWVWRALGDPFGIPGSWNFANFFGLPILIGAGHEYGVFMVHRYRETLQDPRRVWQRWDVSDRALLLCAIVTSCSFGFLAFARHRGLASLGWVMAVGTACIYLATVVVLRPILQLRLQSKGLHGGANNQK